MITKAQILKISDDRKKFLVHIPLFNYAGDENKFTEWATLCYQPGNLESYKVEDVVFVCFENSDIGKPVIIGKLYLGKEDEDLNNEMIAGNLKVSNSVHLPENTNIGNVNFTYLNDTLHATDWIKDCLFELMGKLNDLGVDTSDIELKFKNSKDEK